MTFAKVRTIINKVRMRPGFPFRVELKLETASFYPSLIVAVTAPDSKNAAETVQVYTMATLTPYDLRDITEEILLVRIRDTIHRAIAHEVDEFIEVGGKRIFDPHMDDVQKFKLIALDETRQIPDEAFGVGSVADLEKGRAP